MNLKNLFWLLLVFLLLGQIGLVVARDDNLTGTLRNQSIEDKDDDIRDNSTDDSVDDRDDDDIDTQENETAEHIRERLLEQKREDYKQAKELYDEAKKDWILARTDYLSQKDGVRLENAIDKLKSFLLRSDQAMVEYLENVKLNVNSNENLPAEKKADITSKIDEDISWLKAKQSEINGATTRLELLRIGKDIRDKWEDIKPRHKLISGLFLSYRLTGLLNKADVISQRIQAIIDDLKTQGKDTSQLERLLLDFNSKIEDAQQARQNAISTFQNIDDTTNAEDRAKKGKVYLEQAQRDLRDAHDDLKQILKILKQYNVEQAKGEVNETN